MYVEKREWRQKGREERQEKGVERGDRTGERGDITNIKTKQIKSNLNKRREQKQEWRERERGDLKILKLQRLSPIIKMCREERGGIG